jgi:superfamily II DNA or RNA helicase
MSSPSHRFRASHAQPFRFQPRIRLRTWHRGDGLLGMAPHERFGPREQLTLAQVEWVCWPAGYIAPSDPLHAHRHEPLLVLPFDADWSTPVMPGRWPLAVEGEAQTGPDAPPMRHLEIPVDALKAARSLLLESGLRRVSPRALQWRSRDAARQLPPGTHLTLLGEERFRAFWSDVLPQWQAMGWEIQVHPGFAHHSRQVLQWQAVLHQPGDDPAQARRVGQFRPPSAIEQLQPLHPQERTGSWLLSLKVQVEDETEALDLLPLLARLLRRDGRWLDPDALDAIDPDSRVMLSGPGGLRVESPAGPLKSMVRSLLALLRQPAWLQEAGDEAATAPPLPLSAFEAQGCWDWFQQAGSQWLAASTDTAWQRLQAWQQRLSRLNDTLEGLRRQQRERLQGDGQTPPDDTLAGWPDDLRQRLHPYQREGVRWLARLHAEGLHGVLADDMGLGKTAQALAHLRLHREGGHWPAGEPALVVVPTSLIANWQREAALWAPGLSVRVWHGADRHQQPLLEGAPDLVLTSYTLLWRDLDHFTRTRWRHVVIDEAQWVKNPASHAASALRRLQAQHRLALTGTPLENHLGELWTLFDFLLPGYLGQAKTFFQRYREPIEQFAHPLIAQELAAKVRPFMLRRTREEVLDTLPGRTELIHRLTLDPDQKMIYEAARASADHDLRLLLDRRGIDQARFNVLAALLRLRQACLDPRLLPIPDQQNERLDWPPHRPGEKLRFLMQQLPGWLKEGRQVLVFSQFTRMLDLVAQAMSQLGLQALRLSGELSRQQRQAQVDAFQRGECPVMLLSLKAGGLGLNLTAADTVVLLDPWWNPAVEAQASARAHRQGQTRPVTVHRLVIAGSIEEKVLELQARKEGLAQAMMADESLPEAIWPRPEPEPVRPGEPAGLPPELQGRAGRIWRTDRIEALIDALREEAQAAEDQHHLHTGLQAAAKAVRGTRASAKPFGVRQGPDRPRRGRAAPDPQGVLDFDDEE